MIGPAIGPCCYEVGPEVAERFDADLTREGRLDLWDGRRARARAGPGSSSVERARPLHALPPRAVLLPPRRAAPRRRRPGGDRCSRRLRSRERYAAHPGGGRPGGDDRRRDEVRAARRDGACSLEAGIEVVGENRAQDLEAKHAVYGDAFRWHFIGRLQSNKVKIVNRTCELVHSLDSLSAAARLEVPALAAGQPRRRGGRRAASRPTRSPPTSATASAASRRCRPRPATRRTRGRGFGGCASSPRSTASRELSMGTTQDYRGRRRGGCDVRSASAACSSASRCDYDPR